MQVTFMWKEHGKPGFEALIKIFSKSYFLKELKEDLDQYEAWLQKTFYWHTSYIVM